MQSDIDAIEFGTWLAEQRVSDPEGVVGILGKNNCGGCGVKADGLDRGYCLSCLLRHFSSQPDPEQEWAAEAEWAKIALARFAEEMGAKLDRCLVLIDRTKAARA